MSEDARGARRARVLYIANPGPSGSDSDGSDDGLRNLHAAHNTNYIHTPLRPNRLSPTSHSRFNQHPTRLTTNLPSSNVAHHPSSHPSLSSPSTTSSPAADESTPPPSTPGLPVPHAEFSNDRPSIQEPNIPHSNDRTMSDGPPIITSHTRKIFQTFKSPFRHPKPTFDRPRTVRQTVLLQVLVTHSIRSLQLCPLLIPSRASLWLERFSLLLQQTLIGMSQLI